jgi:uncharacterized 2Fe-2S/4Fe-4S cluster protein (DUF4445 family)
VVSGAVSELTPSEREVFSPRELKHGWRLACQTYPQSDCVLNIPAESLTTAQRTQVEGVAVTVPPTPVVTGYPLELSPPSLADPQADADGLLKALNRQYKLNCQQIDLNALRRLSPQLRTDGWQCRAMVRGDEVIAVNPPSGRNLGLAIDLGTTKIAGYLVDLEDGRTLAAQGTMNPQISYGEDIISRLNRVIKTPGESARMQQLVTKAFNQLATELCAEAATRPEEIGDVVVVGNTVMHHLWLGLPVNQLACPPFVPATSLAVDVKARDLGLNIAPGAYVHLLPNIAGYVGADHLAMLLATGIWRDRGTTLALDIGTNTEVSLVCNGRIATASCASGPAFEGGHIKYGMRAASGAIERLRLVNGTVQYQTIEDAPPVGICGSGILDTVAQLYLAGIIDEGGRMKKGHSLITTSRKQREFIVVSPAERAGQSPITVTQMDIRELQLAKAAIRAGIQALLEASNCAETDIKKVIIAGAFGSYIDVSSAITIGMLPSLPLKRFRQVGNAAGAGARLALISWHKRAEARTIARRIRYIELAGAPGFDQTFVQASYLGQYRITNGNRITQE